MSDLTVGTEVPIIWQGRRAHAFVPAPIGQRDLGLTMPSMERTAAAVAEVGLSAASMPPDYEPLARIMLRSEAVASSYIEGVTAPVVDVVLLEHTPGGHSAAAWVAGNLAAVDDAIASADMPLTVDTLCRWHRTLMTGSPTQAGYVGAVRDEQGWIGGTSPLDAALVTPPPSYLPALLDDLVAYANRSDLDPVAQAAIADAQFEIIHPFGDGNGRVGRVLVSWLLTRRLRLVTPPPVSVRLAADRAGHLAGLTMFRLGQRELWVRWFADAVAGAGRSQRAVIAQVADLEQRWRDQLAAPRPGRGLRSDASAWAVLDLLPRHLVLTAALVARQTHQTSRAAANALHTLVEAGVLVEHRPDGPRGQGRPARTYVSVDLLALSGGSPLP